MDVRKSMLLTSCIGKIPRKTIGYISTLQSNCTEEVEKHAVSRINDFVPSFKAEWEDLKS